ncbi:hypothetical protein [Aneurinibacillus migulanus]
MSYHFSDKNDLINHL